MREALISNARMLNAILDDIVDSAQLMCVDTKMRDLLQALHAPGVRGRMNWEDGMRKIVFNYFGSAVSDYDAYIYDINIFSEDFEYSDQNVFAYTCADVPGDGRPARSNGGLITCGSRRRTRARTLRSA